MGGLRSPGGGGPTAVLFDTYAYLRDEKAAGTTSGDFTTGAWRTRVLNTEVFDPDAIVSLAANQFVLQPGTYFVVARAPAYQVDQHKTRLRNITAGTTAAVGANAWAAGSLGVSHEASWLHGRITPAVATTYELQHNCNVTRLGDGFGVNLAAGGFAEIEIYAEVWIYREPA